MNRSSPAIKTKIILHSFGPVSVLLILFMLSLLMIEGSGARYFIAGLLTAGLFRIILSKRKYIISVQQADLRINVEYLNRMLFKKSISIDKKDLNIYNIKETNWWSGKLDRINFSNGKQNLTFACIDRKANQSFLRTLEERQL
jgi:hypothetical protein